MRKKTIYINKLKNMLYALLLVGIFASLSNAQTTVVGTTVAATTVAATTTAATATTVPADGLSPVAISFIVLGSIIALVVVLMAVVYFSRNMEWEGYGNGSRRRR